MATRLATEDDTSIASGFFAATTRTRQAGISAEVAGAGHAVSPR